MATPGKHLSRIVAESCARTDFSSLDGEVVDRARYLLLDFLGCAIRGTLSDSTIPVLQMATRKSCRDGQVPIIGTRQKCEGSFAALAVGTAAHSLELDDVVNSASLHPAVAVIPAAISAGCQGKSSGAELLSAIVVGYELMVKLGICLKPAAHYRRGFHPTGTCGVFGAAAATARIMRLTAERFSHALGIAGSQAAGSLEFLEDGSFTKRFHAGWAAHSGMLAAELARNGFTGPSSIIEGKFGFLHSYSSESDADALLRNWAAPWEVMNTSIKPHACCRYKQGPIDCLMAIVDANELRAQEIARIDIAVLDAGFALVAEPIDKKRRPQSVVDAQFSMPFGAALAVLRKDASLERYSPEEIESEEIRAFMEKVNCIRDPELDQEFPEKWPARVVVTTTDGREFDHRLEHPKGDPENPLSWEEIIAKFTSLAGQVLPASHCERIVGLVKKVDQLADVSELVEALQAV